MDRHRLDAITGAGVRTLHKTAQGPRISAPAGRENRHGIHLAKALNWLTWLTYSIPKSWLSSLESGGRGGIRTPGLLVANEEKSEIRHGAAIT